ncbi:tRNA uridine-5-carboxymethylaminomethyl(34) synthesis GTPase MnmE [Altericroceibacterium endophyticum]|uniref:tRNA modification GTPase MnmE n=1 Tax=Altericroceibacterium endophyticum TaxID=1808508 RepID=A0A6I4T749_9SPHN|nr:tRNA uridine-5-carboxymethylaminomethyl(34) synthesis GTPase MnmE [Altericroceibacterium endophyticum]
MSDTIFALSSGAPPAGIGVIRITGPDAAYALTQLAGGLPPARKASFGPLRDADGALLDETLYLWFPGPGTASGEDLAELHLHGGRAVIDAVQDALRRIPGLRRAEAGEFTRRAFVNGRVDLAEAEGLADLLSAETEIQRRAAIAMAGGRFSQQVEQWREQILRLSAHVEAVLDFDDEDDVGGLPPQFIEDIETLANAVHSRLKSPRAETLREGFRVALAGPPNAGKSTLFNALVESEAAITAPIPGTTRDVLVQPVSISGIPFSFVDMAGLRDETTDVIETIGIDRAQKEIDRADIVLWLGPEDQAPQGSWDIDAKSDDDDRVPKTAPFLRVSAINGEGMDQIREALVDRARNAMPKPGDVALNSRQTLLLEEAERNLRQIVQLSDPLLVAENLRMTRAAFDRLIGRATTEDVLDTLFGRFCIGK